MRERCNYCKELKNFTYDIVYGFNIEGYSSFKNNKHICTKCLSALFEILDIKEYPLDNKNFRKSNPKTFIQELQGTKGDENNIQFVFSRMPMTPRDYQVFYITPEQKEKILSIVNKGTFLGKVEGYQDLFYMGEQLVGY